MVSGRHQDRKTVKAKQRVRLCEGLLGNSSPKAFYLLTLAMLMKGKLKRTWFLKAPSGTQSELQWIRPGLFPQFCLVTHAAVTGRVVASGMCTNARTAYNFFLQRSWRKWEKTHCYINISSDCSSVPSRDYSRCMKGALKKKLTFSSERVWKYFFGFVWRRNSQLYEIPFFFRGEKMI